MIGLDPGPLTLRKLVWMAAGKWDAIAAEMVWAARAFCGAKIDPRKLNPWRAIEPKSAAVTEAETAASWRTLERWAEQQQLAWRR